MPLAEPFLLPPQTGLRQASPLWLYARDGDRHALAMYRRHYAYKNYRRERQPLFVGPGQKMVLVSIDGAALFAWRKFIDECQPPQLGVSCAIFRNEGLLLSSELITQACALAWQRWPGQRLYTLVNPRKIKSTNPGYCFLMAGWTKCGLCRSRKIIFEKLPC